VLAADGAVSKPLTSLKGTHVSGGAAIWLVGDLDYGLARGFKPLGLEPVAVGLSADADHIITPPSTARAERCVARCVTRRHRPSRSAPGTCTPRAPPGIFQELSNVRSIVPAHVLATAHKGTFGHGMGVGGGWELTAQYLVTSGDACSPRTLTQSEVNAAIRELGQTLVFDSGSRFPERIAGKLSMGVGWHQCLRHLASLAQQAALTLERRHDKRRTHRAPGR